MPPTQSGSASRRSRGNTTANRGSHRAEQEQEPTNIADRFNPTFEAPAALWAALNLGIGGVSGYMYAGGIEMLYMPIGFGLLMALLAVADRRRLIVKFGGSEDLWRQVPIKVRLRFIGRLALIRLLVVLIPGIIAAIAAAMLAPDLQAYSP